MARRRYNAQDGALTSQLALAGTTMTDTVKLPGLPVVTAPDVVVVIFNTDEKQTGAPEIAYITAHTAAASTATVLRAREGTAALLWPVGTKWEHGPTASDFETSIADGTTIASTGGVLGVPVGGIDTPQIANDAVGTAELADDAVTTAKVADGVVPAVQQFTLTPSTHDVNTGSYVDLIAHGVTVPAWATKAYVQCNITGATSAGSATSTSQLVVQMDGPTTGTASDGTGRNVIALGDSQPLNISWSDLLDIHTLTAPINLRLKALRVSGTGAFRVTTTATIVDFTITFTA